MKLLQSLKDIHSVTIMLMVLVLYFVLLDSESFIRVDFCFFVCLLFKCGTYVFPLNEIKKHLIWLNLI